MKWMKIGNFIYMKGKNVFLRAVELEDAEALYQLENDVTIWDLSDTTMPFSRFAIEQYVIESSTNDIFTNKQLRLMIAENMNKKVIGAIDLYNFNPLHRRAGVGILILESYRQKGYASEAMQLLMNYAFSTLQLHQLYCTVSADNKASLALFIRMGFVQTGIYKSWRTKDKSWVDEIFFQYIKNE